MKRPVLPGWVLTRRFALAVSIAVHACIFAFVLFDRGRQSEPKEVVIEFAPSDRVQPPVVEKVVEVSGKEHAQTGRALQSRDTPARQPAAPQAEALEKLLALDLSALRTNVVRTGLKVDGPGVEAANFAPVEPSIHLTETEMDSLVAEEREGAEVGRKRGVKGKQREPAVCILPPRK